MLNQIRNPNGTACLERGVKLGEDLAPFLLFSKVMQNAGGANDVELRFPNRQCPNIALQAGDPARCPPPDAFDRPIQHRTAEVNQRDIEIDRKSTRLNS